MIIYYILSHYNTITTGMPQGSILDPILSFIYLSDLTYSLHTGTAISYADDTTLIIKNKYLEDLIINVYDDLCYLGD